jgi:glycosyltransferase involved in cell wall biosynthesis
MKITIIFNNRLPTERAHGLQIVKMCGAFAEAGAEVELIIPDIYNPLKEDIFAHYQIKENFSVTRKRCFPKKGRYRLRYFTFIINLLFSGIDKNRFIFTRHPEIAFFFSRLGYKVIFEIHNWQKEKTRKNLFFLKKVFLIVSTTKIIKKEFIRSGFAAEKIIVAPNSVELKDFDLSVSQIYIREQLKIPQNKTIVLYAGHLYKRKGVETIIEAAKLLPYKYYFIFIGGLPSDVQNLKELAKDRSNIDIRGHKKYIEVPFYLKAADILVISNSGEDETESTYTSPLKLFEYLAAGKIIVASAVPAIKEFLNEKTAALFKPDDANDLARAIEEISNDSDGQKEIINNGLLFIKRYTWRKRAERIMNYPVPSAGGVSLRASSFAAPSPTTERRSIPPRNKLC